MTDKEWDTILHAFKRMAEAHRQEIENHKRDVMEREAMLDSLCKELGIENPLQESVPREGGMQVLSRKVEGETDD